jgi:hypothetical protein
MSHAADSAQELTSGSPARKRARTGADSARAEASAVETSNATGCLRLHPRTPTIRTLFDHVYGEDNQRHSLEFELGHGASLQTIVASVRAQWAELIEFMRGDDLNACIVVNFTNSDAPTEMVVLHAADGTADFAILPLDAIPESVRTGTIFSTSVPFAVFAAEGRPTNRCGWDTDAAQPKATAMGQVECEMLGPLTLQTTADVAAKYDVVFLPEPKLQCGVRQAVPLLAAQTDDPVETLEHSLTAVLLSQRQYPTGLPGSVVKQVQDLAKDTISRLMRIR